MTVRSHAMNIKKITVLWLAWMFFSFCAVCLAQQETAPLTRSEFYAVVARLEKENEVALARIEKAHDNLEKQADGNTAEITRLKAQAEVWATILSVVSGGTAVLGGVNRYALKKDSVKRQPTRKGKDL